MRTRRTDPVLQWRSDQGGYWYEGSDSSLPFHVTEEAFLQCVHELLLARNLHNPTLAQVIDIMSACRRVSFWLQSMKNRLK